MVSELIFVKRFVRNALPLCLVVTMPLVCRCGCRALPWQFGHSLPSVQGSRSSVQSAGSDLWFQCLTALRRSLQLLLMQGALLLLVKLNKGSLYHSVS